MSHAHTGLGTNDALDLRMQKSLMSTRMNMQSHGNDVMPTV